MFLMITAILILFNMLCLLAFPIRRVKFLLRRFISRRCRLLKVHIRRPLLIFFDLLVDLVLFSNRFHPLFHLIVLGRILRKCTLQTTREVLVLLLEHLPVLGVLLLLIFITLDLLEYVSNTRCVGRLYLLLMAFWTFAVEDLAIFT